MMFVTTITKDIIINNKTHNHNHLDIFRKILNVSMLIHYRIYSTVPLSIFNTNNTEYFINNVLPFASLKYAGN